MQEFGKPAIIIPAFNESDCIGRTIDLVKATRVDASIIVIDDGSTDRTAEIAREKGIEIVRLHRNFGKANAFFAGLKAALAKNPKAIVALDAGMTAVPKESLKQLIDEAGTATGKKQFKMVVANVLESERGNQALTYSGIRAFSLPAARRLKQAAGVKKLSKGYCLEIFLNNFFAGCSTLPQGKNVLTINDSGFRAREQFKNHDLRMRQFREIIAFTDRKARIVSEFLSRASKNKTPKLARKPKH